MMDCISWGDSDGPVSVVGVAGEHADAMAGLHQRLAQRADDALHVMGVDIPQGGSVLGRR